MKRVETVIVGGGPAGAATACGLAALGHDVVLVERAGGPHHKVCGEFLNIETQTQLRRLGVDVAALGAVPIEQVSIYLASRNITAALPFRAMSLSRYRLDEALLRCARDRGAQIKRSVSVQTATPDGAAWKVKCDDGDIMHCRHLVLATGKWGLRGIEDARDNSLVGLKMHLRPTASVRRALAGRVELSLLQRSYVGLELIEDGIANLCFLLPRDVVARLTPGWQAMQDYLTTALPGLAERLAGAEPLWNKAIAVVCPIGGHLHGNDERSVYRVGDRLAHIPPFTGDGLAIALGSAALAVEHIRLGRPPAAYSVAARRLTGTAIRFASTVSGLATSSMGQRALMGAAICAPALIKTIARRTRLPIMAH
ncbi:MAG: NAD(P)/FAD-dependent oxidoreductase [Pseudolabrys sp.]